MKQFPYDHVDDKTILLPALARSQRPGLNIGCPPLSANHQPFLSSHVSQVEAPPERQIKVWVIDDSPTICALVRLHLEREGIAVCTFADGVKALQYNQAHPQNIPHLIYLDVQLPHMNGYEVAKAFRSLPAFDKTMIVLLSGEERQMDRMKNRPPGVQDYLPKPFRAETLAQYTHSCFELATLSPRSMFKDS